MRCISTFNLFIGPRLTQTFFSLHDIDKQIIRQKCDCKVFCMQRQSCIISYHSPPGFCTGLLRTTMHFCFFFSRFNKVFYAMFNIQTSRGSTCPLSHQNWDWDLCSASSLSENKGDFKQNTHGKST